MSSSDEFVLRCPLLLKRFCDLLPQKAISLPTTYTYNGLKLFLPGYNLELKSIRSIRTRCCASQKHLQRNQMCKIARTSIFLLLLTASRYSVANIPTPFKEMYQVPFFLSKRQIMSDAEPKQTSIIHIFRRYLVYYKGINEVLQMGEYLISEIFCTSLCWFWR